MICRLRLTVIPHDVPIQVAAGGKEHPPLGRFGQAVGELHVLARSDQLESRKS